MKNKKLVSVIIPAFNEEENLPRLLKDLKRQTFREFEVIVADAKSKDKTREVAKKFGARVCVGGLPARGRNVGASKAQGKVLVFLDADVRLSPNYLQKNIESFVRLRLDYGVSRIGVSSTDWRDRFIFWLQDVWLRVTQGFWPYTVGFATFMRKEVFEELQGYDEGLKLGEDLDLGERARRKKKKFGILPCFILASARRFERDGRLRLFVKVIWGAIKLKLGFAPNDLSYEWGGYEKKKK